MLNASLPVHDAPGSGGPLPSTFSRFRLRPKKVELDDSLFPPLSQNYNRRESERGHRPQLALVSSIVSAVPSERQTTGGNAFSFGVLIALAWCDCLLRLLTDIT